MSQEPAKKRKVPKYQQQQVAPLTAAERALLKPYVSSLDDNVFVVTGLPGVAGAAFARYSRYYGGVREALAREFFLDDAVNAQRADGLIRRVLSQFGDDSVGEMENAHLALEQVSNLATKELEDRRIGGSPIEQSSRYVAYDLPYPDGSYRYVRPPEILASPHADYFCAVMDATFELYAEVVADFIEYFERVKPLAEAAYDVRGTGKALQYGDCATPEEQKDFLATYRADVRTAACDRARIVLPAATATNVGFNGSGRFYQNLLTHLASSDLREFQELAQKMRAALDTVMPRYVARASRDAYRVSNRRAIAEAVADLAIPPQAFVSEIWLHDPAEVALFAEGSSADSATFLRQLRREQFIGELAYGLFPYTESRFAVIREALRAMTDQAVADLYRTYCGIRTSRRDRPGRGLEWGYPYVIECEADFGIYRDLQRHRMLSQQRQILTTKLGFVPLHAEYVDAGVAERITLFLPEIERLYDYLRKDCGPLVAQYAVLFGYRLRWMMAANGRELMHLLELRTTKQGHPTYRRLCQNIHHRLRVRHPVLAEVMAFVDHAAYESARGESEARHRAKEKRLGLTAEHAD